MVMLREIAGGMLGDLGSREPVETEEKKKRRPASLEGMNPAPIEPEDDGELPPAVHRFLGKRLDITA